MIGANRELLFTTDPVINTPIHPSIGDKIGKTLPALAIPCPIALLKPPYVVILEIARMKQIVKTGNHNSLNVTPNKRPASPKFTFLDINIVMIIVSKMAVPVCPIILSDNTIGLCAISLKVPGKLKLNTKLDNFPLVRIIL